MKPTELYTSNYLGFFEFYLFHRYSLPAQAGIQCLWLNYNDAIKSGHISFLLRWIYSVNLIYKFSVVCWIVINRFNTQPKTPRGCLHSIFHGVVVGNPSQNGHIDSPYLNQRTQTIHPMTSKKADSIRHHCIYSTEFQ